jgi:GTP cyclohydrolase I
VVQRVRVPVTSVCPCSKAISDRGAHNQRGWVTIEARPSDPTAEVWFDDLIAIAESAGSSPVYALLKRPDERHVTMAGYDNPVFVEDMARTVAQALSKDPRIAGFAVRVVNDESIHNHAAYAHIPWDPGVEASGAERANA